MLTIRQLRYFESLCDSLHFGRAARRLNISQPALSAQISQMEEFFGGALFERRSNGIAITAEGALVRARVRRILAELTDLEALASNARGLLSGELRIGIIASLAPYLLPPLLSRLATDYPQLGVGVRENVTAQLDEDLLRGELDCVVQALPQTVPGLQAIELADDPFCLAVPQAQASRITTPVRPAQLRSERLILLEEGHCLRDQALDVCRIAEEKDLASLGATSLTTLLRMVAGGLGVTLVPQSAVEDEGHGGIAFLPFAEPVPSRRLALVFRASSGRAQDFETLAALVREALPRRNAQAPKPG
jgi:LysR family transcriptional regulator, hydrogen peroxide-inducible genes activator